MILSSIERSSIMALFEYPIINIEDYLLLDRNSKNARYEYLDGELRMLAGGSPHHAAIIANLTIAIGRFLTDSSCWIYNSDVQLKLSETRYVHPDVTVSCDERDHESDDVIQYPCLVIEVLSPSTEAIDKIKKLAYYQECPSINEYVMVDSQSIRIEIYHREEDGWKFHTYGPESTVKLESLAIQFAINGIYRGMKLTATRKNKIRES
jgi:Uma2 family endonuclease